MEPVQKDVSKKVEFMKYTLTKILPCLKQIDQEQCEELLLESKIQGNTVFFRAQYFTFHVIHPCWLVKDCITVYA
jgi:hypothetical protein